MLSVKRKGSSPPSQLHLWQEFIGDNIMVHRPLVQVIKLMLSIFPNTSSIERSYSHLKICEKHRNRMIEGTMQSLYMLKVLEIETKGCDQYSDVIKLMEKV